MPGLLKWLTSSDALGLSQKRQNRSHAMLAKDLYSITSSALASKELGTANPRGFGDPLIQPSSNRLA